MHELKMYRRNAESGGNVVGACAGLDWAVMERGGVSVVSVVSVVNLVSMVSLVSVVKRHRAGAAVMPVAGRRWNRNGRKGEDQEAQAQLNTQQSTSGSKQREELDREDWKR